MKLRKTSTINSGAVAKYMLLPGIFPWLRKISAQIRDVFFIFARILGTTNLIEDNHPCLRSENRHLYSCADVLLIAWSNIRFTRKNIPDIFMFFAVLVTLVLFIAILGGVFLQIFLSFGSAQAQYFGTPDTTIPYDVNRDFVFGFLNRVFGGEMMTGINFWVQNESAETIGNPWMSAMLAGTLKLYSQAMLMIASFMVLYIALVTLADSARSGKPFGESFDSIWAPIRIAIAMTLLVPFSGYGYNGAQLIVFKVAEMSSNMATNIWHRTLEDFENCGSEDGSSSRCDFFSTAVSDPGYKYLRDIFLVHMCIYGYNAQLHDGMIADKNSEMNTYRRSQSGDREIYSFGNERTIDFCGQVSLPAAIKEDQIPKGYFYVSEDEASDSDKIERNAQNYLPRLIIEGYRNGGELFLPRPGIVMNDVASRFAEETVCKKDENLMDLTCEGDQPCFLQIQDWIYTYWKTGLGRRVDGNDELGRHFFQAYEDGMKAYNSWIVESLKSDARFGWASAGVFYLRMSSAMNVLSSAISSGPRVIKLPANYYKQNATPKEPMIDDAIANDRCDGLLGKHSECDSYAAAQNLNTLIEKSQDWFRIAPSNIGGFFEHIDRSQYMSDLEMPDGEEVKSLSIESELGPVVGWIFKNFRVGKDNMNPLGTVIDWGDTLFTAASIAYTAAIAASILSWIPGWGAALGIVASLLEMVGNTLVIPGFTLLFIIPFLPFMYFTFAVVEWVVSIVEAVIGMPLWMLTFITSEGNLFDPVMGGIKMLFEILLRPTIIIFSLLASIITFSAGVTFFEDAMILYMGLYGEAFDGSLNIVTSLGLVFIYVFGIYSLATSCFKLIEAIPDQFGRWLDMDGGFGSHTKMGETNAAAVAGAALLGLNAANSIRRDLFPIHDRKRKKKSEKTTGQMIGGALMLPPGGAPPSGSPPPSGSAGLLPPGGGSGGAPPPPSGNSGGPSGGTSGGRTGSSRSSFVVDNWTQLTSIKAQVTQNRLARMSAFERNQHLQDAYALLGVDDKMSAKEVRDAYTALRKSFDHNDPANQKLAQKLATYYDYVKHIKGW